MFVLDFTINHCPLLSYCTTDSPYPGLSRSRTAWGISLVTRPISFHMAQSTQAWCWRRGMRSRQPALLTGGRTSQACTLWARTLSNGARWPKCSFVRDERPMLWMQDERTMLWIISRSLLTFQWCHVWCKEHYLRTLIYLILPAYIIKTLLCALHKGICL